MGSINTPRDQSRNNKLFQEDVLAKSKSKPVLSQFQPNGEASGFMT